VLGKDRCMLACLCSMHSRCLQLKEDNILEGPSIVGMFVLRLQLEFDSKMKQNHNSPHGQPQISLSLSLSLSTHTESCD
jgi:hypothetical protein